MKKEKNIDEMDLLDVRNDFVFKSIFSDSEILIDFLNSMLSSTDKIVEVEVLDSFIKKEFLEDKFSILDIKATTKNKVVEKAVEKLEILSKDKEARILYLKRKEVIEEGRLQLDSAWEGGLEEGIEIGKEQGIEQGELKRAVETAKEMLNDAMPIDVISRYTKLSKEEIISLKEKL